MKKIMQIPLLFACLTGCGNSETCNLTVKGWNVGEPLESSLQPKNELVVQDSKLYINSKKFSKSDFIELMSRTADDTPLYIWAMNHPSNKDCNKALEVMVMMSDSGLCRGGNCFIRK